jgi:sulfur-oxidizing protein SoxY
MLPEALASATDRTGGATALSIETRMKRHPSRREAVAFAGAAAAATLIAPHLATPAAATPDEMAREIGKVTSGKTVAIGRVSVAMPELTENGNSTSLTISVDSPMTAADHVKALHIFSEKNPVPYIARLGIGPHAGRAKVSTSIRVADSQKFTVIAEMSDGTFWSGQGQTEVTTPACIDDSDRPQ